MPTLSAVVAEHPDILSTIVCCLADGGPANVLPLASVCRWTCNAFAPSAEIWRTLCVHKWPSTAALSLDNYREFFLLRSKPPTQVKMGALGAYDDDAEDEPTVVAPLPPKPAPNLQWHPPQNLQDNLQVNDRGWSAPPPNMSMAPTNPLLPPNMATHGLLPPNMSMAPMPNGLDLLTSTATWPNGQPIEWKNWN